MGEEGAAQSWGQGLGGILSSCSFSCVSSISDPWGKVYQPGGTEMDLEREEFLGAEDSTACLQGALGSAWRLQQALPSPSCGVPGDTQ